MDSETISKVKWTSIVGSRYPETLIWRLSAMYWLGIDRDLDEILRTLNMWGDALKIPADGSHPKDWLGFEAFVKRGTGSDSPYSLVSDIVRNLDTSTPGKFTNRERTAQMLLQATVVEYRAAETTKPNDQVPYSNVHMSLMMGPLIIENGVPQSVQGWSVIHSSRPPSASPVKAFMKQVVGSPFWGLGNDCVAEAEIIREVAEASLSYADKPMKTPKSNSKRKHSARKSILEKMHALLHVRVRCYVHAIVEKLLDRSVQLGWDARSNSCQRFCDAIIDRNVFGSFMTYARECKEKNHVSSQPLYLVSFVSRIGCHDGLPMGVVPSSRAAAASGHTEEFLARFGRFGPHNDADIVDSLRAYWTDWAGFREPIFQHQGLFPWDCTEARTQQEEAARPQVKCGRCSLAKHLWAFPFDAWSVAQLHIFRERQFYAPPSSTAVDGVRTQLGLEEWMNNRLGALEAIQALGRVAAAMHRSGSFRSSCQWNFRVRGLVFPHTATKGSLFGRRRSKILSKLTKERHGRLVVRLGSANIIVHDRVKLAGIHRAQPMSYFYEHEQLHDCAPADWADLAHDDQVAAYTALRDFRAQHVDEIIEDAKQRAMLRASRGGGRNNYRAPGPKTCSTGWGDWLLEDAQFPEGWDGLGVEVDYEGQSTCDCVCDVTALAGFDLSPGLGGWNLSEGGDGFSADLPNGGFDGGGFGDGDSMSTTAFTSSDGGPGGGGSSSSWGSDAGGSGDSSSTSYT
ncbi:hypothetical protein LX36DRAFT_702472 [Colletotrichum falcatum]|nr:hypothetical protein LX36DRAFT_702472 [Colletotrichum falcatum]